MTAAPTPRDDGGPAFPVTEEDSSGQFRQFYGMTLRDWFAGQALAGILAANVPCPGITSEDVDAVMAREAYLSADAMLAARKEQP